MLTTFFPFLNTFNHSYKKISGINGNKTAQQQFKSLTHVDPFIKNIYYKGGDCSPPALI